MLCCRLSLWGLATSSMTELTSLCKRLEVNPPTSKRARLVLLRFLLAQYYLNLNGLVICVIFTQWPFFFVHSCDKYKSYPTTFFIRHSTDATFVCNVPLQCGTVHLRLPRMVLERKLAAFGESMKTTCHKNWTSTTSPGSNKEPKRQTQEDSKEFQNCSRLMIDVRAVNRKNHWQVTW